MNNIEVQFLFYLNILRCFLKYATLSGMTGIPTGTMTLGPGSHPQLGGRSTNYAMQYQQAIATADALRKSLNLALQQNSALKGRLNKIYLDADISDMPEVSNLFTFVR